MWNVQSQLSRDYILSISGNEVVVVVTFFNHNFVNCKATLILAIKIYEINHALDVGAHWRHMAKIRPYVALLWLLDVDR